MKIILLIAAQWKAFFFSEKSNQKEHVAFKLESKPSSRAAQHSKANKDKNKWINILFKSYPALQCWRRKAVASVRSSIWWIEMEKSCWLVSQNKIRAGLQCDKAVDAAAVKPQQRRSRQHSCNRQFYLRKISVSNLTFVALLSSEGVAADTATGVAVALLVDGADHAAATLLNTHKQTKKKKWQHFQFGCFITSSRWKIRFCFKSILLNDSSE